MIQIEREKLEKVLKALGTNRVMAQDAGGNYTVEVTPKLITDAMADINESLSQPEQESVATYTCGVCGVSMQMERPWVGLTDEEFDAIYNHCQGVKVAAAISLTEAKLKEKNT